jgi:glutamate synthase (NADPH/NADH) small chain
MGKTTGFLEFERQDETYQAPKERIKNYKEFTIPLEESKLKDQGARCMDCGIPFCHSGCPLGNLIPDFNDIPPIIFLNLQGDYVRHLAKKLVF